MSTERLVRVTCTLPADLVKAADAAAAREGRSRSWVVADALRCHVREMQDALVVGRVSEPSRPPYSADFDQARRQRIEADLALTPEQRVQAVEELAQSALRAHPQPQHQSLRAFDTWEDYFAWKKRDVLL